MHTLSKHWYDAGGMLCIAVLGFVCLHYPGLSHYQLLMWFSLASLLLHQFEEYRFPGTFPGMVNTALYKSDLPDRYPLNARTSLVVNVGVGWATYTLAAIFAEETVWLGLATILISIGNTIAHTLLFNIKGKTMYNAGLVTSWLLFVPCSFLFFRITYADHLIQPRDYLIGIPLGIALNVIGIIKIIDWMSDKNTKYIFPQRNLLRSDRMTTR